MWCMQVGLLIECPIFQTVSQSHAELEIGNKKGNLNFKKFKTQSNELPKLKAATAINQQKREKQNTEQHMTFGGLGLWGYEIAQQYIIPISTTR